ncbi:hypothetical protein EVAR_12255_1 [Eumeta japonica]|uniref:Uncharacterized protein n=1 Tax=Eumeta variegata TaxID=151549 RepID=A0A4C1TUH5_EUMVA|nr:hypothetical protein EVAR_12255_1 [Eumeta japonica]
MPRLLRAGVTASCGVAFLRAGQKARVTFSQYQQPYFVKGEREYALLKQFQRNRAALDLIKHSLEFTENELEFEKTADMNQPNMKKVQIITISDSDPNPALDSAPYSAVNIIGYSYSTGTSNGPGCLAGGSGCVYLCASYRYRMRTSIRNRCRQPDSPDPNRKSKRDDISINQLT